jgi:hypothetical protein
LSAGDDAAVAVGLRRGVTEIRSTKIEFPPGTAHGDVIERMIAADLAAIRTMELAQPFDVDSCERAEILLELIVAQAQFDLAAFKSPRRDGFTSACQRKSHGRAGDPAPAPAPAPLLLLAFSVATFFTLGREASAEWKPEHDLAPPEVQEWYRIAELTETAQKRFGFKSCCAHSDVIKTTFRVDKASDGDAWYWFKDGQWSQIPADIIHWGESAPDRRPTLFAIGNLPTCFYPGEGGL